MNNIGVGKSGLRKERKPEFYSTGEKNEESEDSRRKKLSRMITCATILISLCIFCWILFTCHTTDIRFDSEKVNTHSGTWKITHSGRDYIATLPYKEKIPAGETVVFSAELVHPEKAEKFYYNSIMFRAFHEYVKVYLDQELLYEFGYNQSVPFSDAPNNGWIIVRLPEDFAGKTLHIEKCGYYDGFGGNLSNVYLGTKNALVFYVLNRCVQIIFINICIMLLSICLLITSFFFKRKNLVYQLRYLSVFSLITSLWLLLESGGYQLFAGRPPLISNTVFILFSMIPVIFVRFLKTYDSFKDSKYINVLFYSSFGCFLLVHMLQIMQIADYIQSIFITHIMLILIITSILVRYIQMRIKKEKIVDSYLFVSCLVLAFFAIGDIVRFYFVTDERATIFSQVGLLVYFVILSYFAIKKIVIDNENSINKMYFEKMAYLDILTGLPNRNAFEREMSYYRNNKAELPVIMIMDLNGLKVINDQYGHGQGDQAIMQVATLMKESFASYAHVFRIGGDEFCAIFSEITKSRLEEQIAEFRTQISDRAKVLQLPMSVAIGWFQASEAMSIDKVFNKADANMYQNKKQCKDNHTSL